MKVSEVKNKTSKNGVSSTGTRLMELIIYAKSIAVRLRQPSKIERFKAVSHLRGNRRLKPQWPLTTRCCKQSLQACTTTATHSSMRISSWPLRLKPTSQRQRLQRKSQTSVRSNLGNRMSAMKIRCIGVSRCLRTLTIRRRV